MCLSIRDVSRLSDLIDVFDDPLQTYDMIEVLVCSVLGLLLQS